MVEEQHQRISRLPALLATTGWAAGSRYGEIEAAGPAVNHSSSLVASTTAPTGGELNMRFSGSV